MNGGGGGGGDVGDELVVGLEGEQVHLQLGDQEECVEYF